jgi:hyperosmotically inducible periplasmic protein
MKASRLFPAVATLLVAGVLGCSSTPKSPEVADRIRASLRQAGLQDVSVSQDVDKGVVTLSGNVPGDADKAQAEAIAKSIAGVQVVSDQIAVRPPGDENTAKKVDSALDQGIEKNLDAVLIQRKLEKDVKYDVKNGVVTLKGEVRSQATRDVVEKLARAVPNVQQVVNELQVKNQKASTSD